MNDMNYRVEEVREFVNEKLMVNGKLNELSIYHKKLRIQNEFLT